MSGNLIKFGLPKGQMEVGVRSLLEEAGIVISVGQRAYRPSINLDNFETKILKPQNIVKMLNVGSRDIGFAGADWVKELQADLVELVDTELDPVRIVAAAPKDFLANGKLPNKNLRIASEYQLLTESWIKEKKLDASFIRTWGATEVFPPEDADCIVDNTATGSTLRANNLEIVDTLMTSSTRLYAHPKSLANPSKKEQIENFCMLISSVLAARKRVMLEVNVSAENLEKLVAVIPSMQEPTIAQLHAGTGYAIKAAVPKKDLPKLIPLIKANGGTDIVVSKLSQLVA